MVKFERKTIFKAAVLLLFVIGAIYLLQQDAVQELLSTENIEALLSAWGPWAPVAYILFYVTAVSLLAPGTPITAVGAILFGTLGGFIYTIIGATIGASVSFWIARTLGHDFAQRLFGERIRKYDEKIAAHGFTTIFYLRLLYFPFNVLNFGAGLTQVKFRDYFWGTFLGIIPGTFIFTFFVDSLRMAIVENGLFSAEFGAALLSARVLGAIFLFIASFFIPSCVKFVHKKCKEKGWITS